MTPFLMLEPVVGVEPTTCCLRNRYPRFYHVLSGAVFSIIITFILCVISWFWAIYYGLGFQLGIQAKRMDLGLTSAHSMHLLAPGRALGSTSASRFNSATQRSQGHPLGLTGHAPLAS
jgi:hypothetical protein